MPGCRVGPPGWAGRLALTATLIVVPLVAHAQSPSLVKDINTFAQSSSPGFLTAVNGNVFFAATDPAHGRELWKSDGTGGGTVLVADVLPGQGSSGPTSLASANGKLFFIALPVAPSSPLAPECALYVSDGTAAGTTALVTTNFCSDLSDPTEINGLLYFFVFGQLSTTDGTSLSGSLSLTSSSYGLTDASGTAFFVALGNTLNQGQELWKSDGTAAGTVQVADINPGSVGSQPWALTNVNGTLFFFADDGTNGRELWKSDGTAGGTVLVKDINPGSGGSNAPFSGSAVNVNGTLFFTASDGTTGDELWMSDGTDAGTVLVKDINPGPGDSAPDGLTNVNGTLFFRATDGVHGTELWTSDGTAAGTVMVEDLNPGAADSGPSVLLNVNGTLFFSATDGTTGFELWKSDGTAAGTVLVKDINPGPGDSVASALTNLNGTLFFAAFLPTTGVELWKSDGTGAGTVLVQDINTSTADSNPGQFAGAAGGTLFTASDGLTGVELWKTDGTLAGTALVDDINPGPADSSPASLTPVGSTVFFVANDGTVGNELWKSDGSPAGTVLVKDISPGSPSSSPSALTNVGGTLFFAANDGITGTELWKSDGTPGGTLLVKDINPGASGSNPSGGTIAEVSGVVPLPMVDVNGTLFFRASDGSTGNELWKSDGTSAGTVLVKDIHAGPASSGSLLGLFDRLINVGGTLFLNANDGTTGFELWKSDGTAAGTVLVKDINPGAGDSLLPNTQFTDVNGTLFFVASDGTHTGHGAELWKSDGTAAGTVLVLDIVPGVNSSVPSNLTNMNGTLFFTANDGVRGNELWKSNGTAASTQLVMDINPGAASSSPSNLQVFGGRLFFVADDGVHGPELWTSDGTAAGTVLAADIFPGSASSSPAALATTSGGLFFNADDGSHGRELWAVAAPPAATCATTPATGCHQAAPQKSSIAIVDNTTDPTKKAFKWKWKAAATDTTTADEFRDPVNGTPTVRACVYDGSGNLQPLMQARIVPGGTCAGKPCWKLVGSVAAPVGDKYKNKAATPDGLTDAKLKAGAAGKAQVGVKGKGSLLQNPALQLTLPVTVQLLIGDGSGTACWQTTYSNSTTNDPTQFKAKGP
jgi:ELWxxDGT repeat protein